MKGSQPCFGLTVWMVALLACGAGAAGCDEESTCPEPFDGAYASIVGTWAGSALVVSQQDIQDLRTDVSLAVQEEQCALQATFRELDFGICGSDFTGTLSWDAEEELWTGSFVESSEELTRFTMQFEVVSSNTGELFVELDESTVLICEGNVIEGSLTRR